MDGTDTQRLSQENQCHQDSIGGILEPIKTFARRVLKSVQAVAGTTDCKGVQITRKAEWANHKNSVFGIVPRNNQQWSQCFKSYVIVKESRYPYILLTHDYTYCPDSLPTYVNRLIRLANEKETSDELIRLGLKSLQFYLKLTIGGILKVPYKACTLIGHSRKFNIK